MGCVDMFRGAIDCCFQFARLSGSGYAFTIAGGLALLGVAVATQSTSLPSTAIDMPLYANVCTANVSLVEAQSSAAHRFTTALYEILPEGASTRLIQNTVLPSVARARGRYWSNVLPIEMVVHEVHKHEAFFAPGPHAARRSRSRSLRAR
jgi:hypothetical protein